MLTWVEKHRPEKLEEIAGNPSAIKTIISWLKEWKKGRPKKRAILLYGPAGVGKTSCAYAIARELNSDIIELNASDFRTKDVINRVVGGATQSGLLSQEKAGKVIIIDEVDGIHGRAEYGGLSALIKLIKVTPYPIVLIANDPWKLSPEFRNLTQMVEFRKITERTVLHVLKEIARKEGIKADEKALKVIAANSGGDLRAAINDLQAVAQGKNKLEVGDVISLFMRDSEVKIFDVLVRILKTESIERAREALQDSEEDPETVLRWLVENVPIEYKNSEDLAKAMNYLSRADVFLGRIRRRQDWGLLKYAMDLMSAGVAKAKSSKYKGFTRYSYPKTFVMLARTKKSREETKELALKLQGREGYSNKIHASLKVIKQEFLPLAERIMENNIGMAAQLASELEFDLKDIEAFVKNKDKAKEIFQLSQKITQERLRKQMKGDKSKQISLFEFG